MIGGDARYALGIRFFRGESWPIFIGHKRKLPTLSAVKKEIKMKPAFTDPSIFEDIKKVFLQCNFPIANSGQDGVYLFLSSGLYQKSQLFKEEILVRYNLINRYIKISRIFLEPVSDEKVIDLLIILNFINCSLLSGSFHLCLGSGYVTSQHGMFVTGNNLDKDEFEKVLKQLVVVAYSNYAFLKAFLVGRITKNQCLHDITLSMEDAGVI
jgi:hypothetical protein